MDFYDILTTKSLAMKLIRNQINTLSLIFVFFLFLPFSMAQQKDKRPNIIYIFTDQQHANMMSCAGNPWLETPAMDYIAENGIRFTRAYRTNPVCVPARVSMMTGRFPGAFRDENGDVVRSNRMAAKIPSISQEQANTTLAAYMKKAGYDLIYGGKEHLPKPLRPGKLGFTDISDDERFSLALTAADFIRRDHEKPYFMIISLINPHDICYMALRDFATTPFDSLLVRKGEKEIEALDWALQKPAGMSEEVFFANYCPPVPPNLEPQEDEPEALKALINERPFRKKAREQYTDEDWRMQRYAYARLTERVDSQIGIILTALAEAGREEETLVMFSSDHGDNNGSHRMEHKTTLYEESANVPFIAMWKGHISSGKVDSTSLVSNGLDLLPTVCDYAGIKGVSDPRGRSLKPLFEGNRQGWRETLGVDSQVGRMIVSEDGYKYIQYDMVGFEEQLLDLNLDPYETTHFTNSPVHQQKLKQLRENFKTEWFPNSKND
jgi:choline-sulfatase